MKLNIDSQDVWDVVKELLEFPMAQICRHYVVGMIVQKLFEEEGNYPLGDEFNEFCKFAVAARDAEALEAMNRILERDTDGKQVR